MELHEDLTQWQGLMQSNIASKPVLKYSIGLALLIGSFNLLLKIKHLENLD